MAYALDYPAQLIQKVTSVVDLADRMAYLEPSPESQLGREMAALPEPAARFLDDARGGAAARLVAIEDHMHAMAVLLRERTVVYAVYSLIRPVAEMAGIARWLTDPQVAARERAQRAYADRLRSLVKMKSLRDAAITRHADERLRRLTTAAGRAGVGAANFPCQRGRWRRGTRPGSSGGLLQLSGAR